MYVDGKEEHIEIFDTAGQEEYMILQDQWIKEGNCFLVLFAVNEKGSLEKTLSLVDKIRELHDDSMPM
jgi:GTPase SAR1 family protein